MKNFKIFATLTVILYALIFSCPSKAVGSTTDLVNRVQPATVKVLVYDKTGTPIKQGSGFLFKTPGRLITNYHVLGKAEMAKVRTLDGREFNIRTIVAEDEGDDLVEAAVDITTGTLPYLVPAVKVPVPGDAVTVIGSPLGVEKVVSQGSVTAIQEVQKYGKSILHTAHSFPGSSGSPLVNDQGEVVGIETAAVPGRPDINLAIPLERFTGLKPNFRQLQIAAAPVPKVKQGIVETGSLPKDARTPEPDDPAAQVNLGLKYELGQGVAPNCFEALSLYRKAATRGYLQAEYHIGRMYYDGKCTGKNLNEAASWLKKAADSGFPEAQRLYGTLCFNGEGVPRDRVGACMWMTLAAFKGNQEANKILRYMSAELTQDELKTARERARTWKPIARPGF
jgi:TPR repeat protein